MKKALFVVAVAGVMGFYACKKEDKTVTVTNTVNDTITNTIWLNGQVNPDTLTAGITVAYATQIADAVLPTASTDADAPFLDTLYNRTYKVIEGQYLIIYPPAVRGYISGYYVQIAGAKSYFKVDYSTAIAERKAARAKANGFKSDLEGFVDSTIVIRLPLDIKGDTFYVKYAAYDNSNRVSGTVTATALIQPQGSAAFTDSLAGNWEYYGSKTYSSENYEEEWNVDTINYAMSTNYYNCVDGKLVLSSEATDIQLIDYAQMFNETFVFNKDHSMSVNAPASYRTLDLENSTCSSFAYTYQIYRSNESTATYYYDPAVRKLTLVYGTSNLSAYYSTYMVLELTDKRLVIANSSDEYEGNYLSMRQYYKN